MQDAHDCAIARLRCLAPGVNLAFSRCWGSVFDQAYGTNLWNEIKVFQAVREKFKNL